MHKRYDRYKDSGVEWIGEVPEHWSVNKLGYLLKKNDGGVWGDDPKENGVIVLRSTEITLDGRWNINEPAKRSLSNKEYNNALLVKGDLLLTKSSGSEQHIGKTAIVDNSVAELRCAFSNFMQRLRTKKIIFPKYLYYFLNTNGREQLLHLSTTTTGLKNLSGAIINNLKVQSPTTDEQKTIAHYLDQKTSEIDSLIADKEELIIRLEEYKQSIITEAVTKGLYPDVKMKDSGVEWIGEIPEHWEVKKLQYSGFCQNGVSKGADYFGKGYPFVSYGDVYNNVELPLLVEGLADANLSDRNLYSVCEEDIFFTRTSETIEEIGITSTCLKTIKDATFSGFLIRFRPIKGFLYKHFSKYYFRSYMHRRFFVKEMNLVTRASLSQGLLKRLPIISPPYKEQIMVADYLDELTTDIDSSIDNLNKQIDLALSYRQSLIYEAVTGKIDVRDYQSERSEQFA